MQTKRRITDGNIINGLSLKYKKAVTIWKTTKDPSHTTLPSEFREAVFYQDVRKPFCLTLKKTNVPVPIGPDGRFGQEYTIGACVVLESAPNNEPTFAVIDGIVESCYGLNGVRYDQPKIFLLIEYLFTSQKNPVLTKTCNYCMYLKNDHYVPSECLENGCMLCSEVVPEKPLHGMKPPGDEPVPAAAKEKTIPESKDNEEDEGSDSSYEEDGSVDSDLEHLIDSDEEEQKELHLIEIDEKEEEQLYESKTKKKYDVEQVDTEIVPKTRKTKDHDRKMMELLVRFPGLHRIPYEHYHTNSVSDLVEISNVVTKVNMIRDHRAFPGQTKCRAFFYIERSAKNM